MCSASPHPLPPAKAMSHDHENKTTAKIGKKRSFSCISFCFTGSPVLDDDRPALATGSKRKPSPWFSWARSRKKMKSTPGATFPAKNPRRRPATLKTSSKENSGPVSTLELEHTNLPPVAARKDSERLSAGSSFNSAKFQTGPRTSKPGTPRRIAGGAADTAVVVRGGTLEPVVGLWLMVGMLAVMVLAGPATAVLCFCSCLYLCPRSSPGGVVAADSGGFREDLNSAEHKKRVILEGLLERNGRRPSFASSTDRMR